MFPGDTAVAPRIATALELLRGANVKAEAMLDLSCNDGSVTIEIAKAVGAKEVYGVDIDENALKLAAARGIKVFKCDLSRDPIPIDDESVDLVTALEVIEHLVNPDHMLREIRRVLKPGGALLLTTPNLASWVNRLIFLLGYQPYNAEVSTEILAGVPWKAHSFSKPSGHIRPFTLRALKELLHYHGFKVAKVVEAPGVNPPIKAFQLIDRIFSLRPSLARRLIVLAYKV